MRALLRNFLADECEKHKARHFEYLYELEENIKRKNKRNLVPAKKTIHKPAYWGLDDRFNPFKVSSDRRLDLFSYTLAKKILRNQYSPMKAVRDSVLKESGNKREINVFQLPDAAVSRLVYKSLLHKNVNRLSSGCYAYREDKGAHDAVFGMYSDWKVLDRAYVAEFDFSKFFDNIDHTYLWSVFEKASLLYTEQERHVLEAFLRSESAEIDDYKSGPTVRRTQGIPQGTSISLFLANAACWELDRALERLGVSFCRYADDTVIWSESYSKIVSAYDVIKRYSGLMSVPINLEKSEGIHLLTREKDGELKSKRHVDYLGYKLSLNAISIKQRRVENIKKKLSYIAYENLLQPLKYGIYNKKRLGAIDWDYMVALSQIRRYLYGGLTDERLRKYIRGQLPRLNFRGLMSYYPLVNDGVQLAELDGWLIYVLRQSLRVREKMWVKHSGVKLPGPIPDWIENLTELKSWKSSGGTIYDFRVPSFSLINEAMQVALVRSGLSAVANPVSIYYE